MITEIDFSAYLPSPPEVDHLIKATGYSGNPIWAKHNGTTWVVYYTKPTGSEDIINVGAAFPSSPVNNAECQVMDYLDNTNKVVPFYWSATQSKWKCGRPNDR